MTMTTKANKNNSEPSVSSYAVKDERKNKKTKFANDIEKIAYSVRDIVQENVKSGTVYSPKTVGEKTIYDFTIKNKSGKELKIVAEKYLNKTRIHREFTIFFKDDNGEQSSIVVLSAYAIPLFTVLEAEKKTPVNKSEAISRISNLF